MERKPQFALRDFILGVFALRWDGQGRLLGEGGVGAEV